MAFKDDNVERAQNQPPASRESSLSQVEKPTKAAKRKQRKRAPKDEIPLVQSDARPEVLEVENKNQGPPASRESSLDQGTVAITMEEPAKAAKSKQRTRAPKEEKPLVQSDARPEVLEVESKNQGTRCSHCRSILF